MRHFNPAHTLTLELSTDHTGHPIAVLTEINDCGQWCAQYSGPPKHIEDTRARRYPGVPYTSVSP